MAAGQQKKRLHASSVVSCDLQERMGTKKKRNVVSPPNFLNIKAHITLEWDEHRQKVFAKREQIGITWRNLGPFVNPLPPHHSALADVISIPQEVFGLEDLSGVISYEVWETQLSETEKSFLTQLLPRGTDTSQVVQSLLTGENLYFGNPFQKWSVSLCSGELHPDAILCQERRFTASKKSYDSELHEYYNEYLDDNVVENLQKLKETWTGRDGPERDIVEKMWRQVYAEKCGNISAASARPKVVACSRKEDKPLRLFVRSGDGAKYMSYFKITKKQHQLVKGIKQPDGIKSKCLNHILGDIESLQVQPYEVYEEEENKKLHEHWLHVSNKDIPFAFTQRMERRLKRKHWRRSLEQELQEYISLNIQDVKESPIGLLIRDRGTGEVNEAVMTTTYSSKGSAHLRTSSRNVHHEIEHVNSEENKGNLEIFTPEELSPVLSEFQDEQNPQEPLQQIPSLNGHNDPDVMSTVCGEDRQDIFKPEDGTPVLPTFMGNAKRREASEPNDGRSVKTSVSYYTDSQSLQQIPSLNGHHELDPLDVELGESSEEIRKPDGGMRMCSQFVENIDPTGVGVQQRVPSAKDEWLEMGLPDSYHDHMRVTHDYTSSNDISLGQQHFVREQPAHLIDLETEIIKGDDSETLLHAPSADMTSGFHINSAGSFSSSYANQDRNELFHPCGLLPFQANDQKQINLQYLGRHDLLLESGHLQQQQQQQLLEQRQQMRERDYYMQRVVHKNMYANSGGFTPSSQQFFSPVNMQNWAVNPTTETTTLQACSIGREPSSENPSSAGRQADVGWSNMDVSSSSQYLGTGINADGSLYSVLSQFNKTQQLPHSMPEISEQGVGPRKVGGGSFSSNGIVFPHTGHQLNYSSGHEAGSTMKVNNTSWGDLPQQTSGLHDSVGKPFLRSWKL